MGKNIAVFLAMLVVIALLAAVAFTGVDLVIFEIPSVQDGIRQGLDLRGGSIITYEAESGQINPDTLADDMETARAMLRQRLDAIGLYEASLYKTSDTRLRVEIPDLADPEEAVKTIGSTAQLEFRDFEDKVWLTGDAVESATAKFGPTTQGGTSQHYVELTFKSEYREAWTEATKYAAGQESGDNYIAIYMDNEMVFNPTVGSEYASTGIDSDSCIVTFGGSAADTARNFADLVRIGRLPFKLNQVQLSTVGPTLGANALNTSLIAGAIGLALVILFMIVYYRLPGLMAAIALVLYVALVAVTLSILRVNLSLPGIAGIILGIGMAVDANVVIFERIKEELRSGKTVRSSVESGFKRALSAIIDGNITTVIAGVVLLAFGTGSIQGFAVTLLVGVILSMFTVLVVSRMLLKQMCNLGVTKLAFYGVSEDRSEPRLHRVKFSYVKNLKWLGLPSLLICAFSIVTLLLLPFGVNLYNFDVDFVGGTSYTFDIGKDVTNDDMDAISAIVQDKTGLNPSAPQKVGSSQVLIKTPVSDADTETKSQTRDNVISAVKTAYPDMSDEVAIDDVGTSVGSDLQRAAILSIVVAAVLMLIYITFRFQFSSGLAAVMALIHDLLIIMAGYAIFQIPINMNFIAVMLTILGYSINSTIVVFDRVRENKRLMQKSTFGDIIDRGIKQTMGRNINTTMTTLLPVICIIILGVPSVRNFAIPLTIGLLSGAYSSICLAGSFWHRISNADKNATEKLAAKAK